MSAFSLRRLALACWIAAAATPALAGRLADVQVIDRHSGRALPQTHYQGRLYVAGEPGHAYEISVRNNSGERLLAVMSVDGVNVLSGETAGTGQGGYVFGPFEQDSIKGWRKNLDEIAQFHFTALPNSYAARTGRPDNVGVIGAALFREAPPPPPPRCAEYEPDDYAAPSSADSAKESAGAASRAQGAERAPAPRAKAAPKLGTGHGAREYSSVATTSFERASDTPDEVISLYYDSRPNLVAQGVLPPPYRYPRQQPEPFPGGFVPDP